MADNIAAAVIAKFGGLKKASKAIGAPPSTIQSWREAGRIPRWRRAEVIAAAEREKIDLPDEFLKQKAA
jgi:hypothetical protein